MLTFKKILDTRFGGTLAYGKHDASDNKVCAIELLSVKKGVAFTDQPYRVNCFDFREINDIDVPGKLRAEHMLPMLETYEDSLNWKEAKQKRVVGNIIISTVNQLITDLPELSEEVMSRCKEAKTLKEAQLAVSLVGDNRAAQYITQAASFYFNITDYYIPARKAASCAHVVAHVFSNFNHTLAYLVSVGGIYSNPDVATQCAAAHATKRAEIFTKACKLWIEAAKD